MPRKKVTPLTAEERKLCANPRKLAFEYLSNHARAILTAHNDKWIQVYLRGGFAPPRWEPRNPHYVGRCLAPDISYRIDPKAPVVKLVKPIKTPAKTPVKTPAKAKTPVRTYDDIVAAARLAGINRRLEALKAAIDEYLAPLP
jgi:hypothetical protein